MTATYSSRLAAIILLLALAMAATPVAWAAEGTAAGQLIWQRTNFNESLYALHMAADGKRGWAVGEAGTILTTSDGGAKWDAQTSPTTNNLWGVQFLADGKRGWAVGEAGTILTTSDGGAKWDAQTSPTTRDLRGVQFLADGKRGWAVGEAGTILVASWLTDPSSVLFTQSAGQVALTFAFPMGDYGVQPRIVILAGLKGHALTSSGQAMAEPGTATWRFTWEPAKSGFLRGNVVSYAADIVVPAGGTVRRPLGESEFNPEPPGPDFFQAHRTEILAVGSPFAIFALYAIGFLGLLLVAPARLASIGAAPLNDIPAPSGNAAFAWSLLKKAWDTILLRWLCRHRRVRRAWSARYRNGDAKLADLGKFARESFLREPEVLDAWVAARIARAQQALESLDLYRQRRTYVPLPVRVDHDRIIVERPDAKMLRETFDRDRAVLAIVAGGGGGKSTLACAIARWAMASTEDDRLARHRMLPVFIVQDTVNLVAAVTAALRQMLGDEELPDDLVRGLLARQRLLLVIDALSEREPATQAHVEGIFDAETVFNAVVITSRTDPRLGAVIRTSLYPELLDQRHIVPFIIDYVARLDGADALRRGQTQLELGGRILALAEAGENATPVTPLLVRLFVDSALNRTASGQGLGGMPQDVAEIFLDYLRRVWVPVAGVEERAFVDAAKLLAGVSLGPRRVPGDFSRNEAIAPLKGAFPENIVLPLLDQLISSGVVERRSIGGVELLRFSLDPVAEYLTAIRAIEDLRHADPDTAAGVIEALTKTDGYPIACDGYLRAFATCYRGYRVAFRLPEARFPWEPS